MNVKALHSAQRLATAIAALAAFAIAGNPCTIGIAMGRGPMACMTPAPAVAKAPQCPLHAAASATSSEASAAPSRTSAPCSSKDRSCCDLKSPATAASPAVSGAITFLPGPGLIADIAGLVIHRGSHGRVVAFDTGPPTRLPRAALSTRAPPLS